MPTLTDKVRSAIKIFFPGYGGSAAPGRSWRRHYLSLPQSNWNYENEIGDPWTNGVVAPVVAWIQRNCAEADLQVLDCSPPEDTPNLPLFSHPLLDLINNPNPYYDGDVLFYATRLSLLTNGNAYWYKIRDKRRVPIGILYLPHFSITPQWPEDGKGYISKYRYRVNGSDYFYDPEDIIHFRIGMDPRNTRMGWVPLNALFREIFTDNEAANYTASLMRNMGTPGVIFSPVYPEDEIGDIERQALLKLWKEKFTGEGRGEPFMASLPIKIDNVAFTPEQLVLDKIRVIPEDRICAALGVPSMVVGLSSGHDQRTYSNYKEARMAAYDNCIRPIHRAEAKALNKHLLPDLSPNPYECASWSYKNVSILEEDKDRLYKRVTMAYLGGWMKRSEARAKADLPFDDSDHVYVPNPKGQPVSGGTEGEAQDTTKQWNSNGNHSLLA